MEHWYVGGIDVDFTSPIQNSYNTVNIPTNSPPSTYTSNGLYDDSGNMIFFIENVNVYAPNGAGLTPIGVLDGSSGAFVFETSIVPSPANCDQYLVFYSVMINNIMTASFVTIDIGGTSSNPGVPNIIYNGHHLTGGLTFDGRRCGFAISKEINQLGERYLYLVEGTMRSSQNYFGHVKKFLISSSGAVIYSSYPLSSNDPAQDFEYTPFEVALSHDGTMLAWGGEKDRAKIYILNLNSLGDFSSIDSYNAISYCKHGVEFSPDNSRLFFTNVVGDVINYIDINTGQVVNAHYSQAHAIPKQIELANDGLLYFSSSGSSYASINPTTLAIGNKYIACPKGSGVVFNGYWMSFLPNQIDGNNYDYVLNQQKCCLRQQTYTVTQAFFSTTSTWTPASNPFQSGQATVSTSAGFTIGSGTKVTISNMTIEFEPEAKVIVEPGGYLILDNTIFTSVDCPVLWPGVEVWGNKNQSQNQWSGNGMNTHQGRITVKNNSQINNALTAIQAIKENPEPDGGYSWSKTGGIIELYGNSQFKNNRKAIWIGGYRNYLPGYIDNPNYIRPNRSYISNCTFLTDDNFNGGVNFHSFIALYNGSSINIQGNIFQNSSSSTIDKMGIGILSINFPMQVKNNNVFDNLLYGIKAVSFDRSIYYAIDENSFENCYHSIFMDHTWGSKITSNNISVPESDALMSKDPYGLYLDGARAFHVEDNKFSSNYYSGSHGIIAKELGAMDNEIYRNEFTGLNYGIKPQMHNKGVINTKQVGLKLFCNEFYNANKDYDILVLGKSVFDLPYINDNIGIAYYQKIKPVNDPIHDYYPAGNIFTNTRSSGTFDLDNDQADYLVYTHQSNTPTLRYEPEYSSNIGLTQLVPPTNSCPSKLGGGGDIITETALLAQAQVALNSSVIIRDVWKDGGQTNLDEQVETTQPWEVYIQFNELISESPYLSDEVLMATI